MCTEASIQPRQLTCEYLTNPLGIDSPNPRFGWQLTSNDRGQGQTAYRILVSGSLENLGKNIGDKWDSGKIAGDSSIQIPYAGKKLSSGERCFWKVMCWDREGMPSDASEPAFFEMGLLGEEDWKGEWIGAEEEISSPLLRKTFAVSQNIKNARAYVCGLGYYEFYINGQKVGDHVLDPGWTDYDRRELKGLLYPFEDRSTKSVLYVTYDITEYLKVGKNAAGVMLGNGWYNQRERTVEGCLWYDMPKLLLQIQIEYTDGSTAVLCSDSSWKFCKGPITFNNIFYGEIYDARLEPDGWNLPEYDDTHWKPAKKAAAPAGKLKSQLHPPDKVVQTLQPVSMDNPQPDFYIIDFGQNFSGWVRLKAAGPAGTCIKLRFSEERNEGGMLDFSSTGGEGQIQSDTWYLKGDGMEVYEPRFTWHGFRYVELSGYPGELSLSDIEGRVVHSAVQASGSFHCSNELLNKIHSCYTWSQWSNLHGGVPSDCPHRERLGYTGDGQVTAEAAALNFDMAQFYTKWIGDLADAQNKNTGFVPHTAPFYGGGGGPAWGSAYVIVPWVQYLYYGDVRILEEHYAGMKHWLHYMSERTEGDHIIVKEEPGSWCLGDWCVPGELKLQEKLVNTFYYAYITRLMCKISGILGKHEEREGFAERYDSIIKDFHQAFYNATEGCYSIGIQGADVFPLALGCVPAENQDQVLEHLVGHISRNLGGHLDTGIFGTAFLFDVLVEYGYTELAYEILNKKTYPGYGYLLENGATTLWEQWDGGNSHNHPMFGSVSAWFYKNLAGIQVDSEKPAFKNTVIKPSIPVGLRYASARLNTLYGVLSVEWSKQESFFGMKVEIPCNCSARVHIPLENEKAEIFEGDAVVWKDGICVDRVDGLSFLRVEKGYVVFLMDSGKYTVKRK